MDRWESPTPPYVSCAGRGEAGSRVTAECGEPLDLLLVEDNEGDVNFIRNALEESPVETALHVVSSGTEALEYLHQRGDYETVSTPDIVLLDLNLPEMSGIDILESLDESPLDRIPVLVITGSTRDTEIADCYDRGANAYFVKPADPDDYIALVRSIVTVWGEFGRLPET